MKFIRYLFHYIHLYVFVKNFVKASFPWDPHFRVSIRVIVAFASRHSPTRMSAIVKRHAVSEWILSRCFSSKGATWRVLPTGNSTRRSQSLHPYKPPYTLTSTCIRIRSYTRGPGFTNWSNVEVWRRVWSMKYSSSSLSLVNVCIENANRDCAFLCRLSWPQEMYRLYRRRCIILYSGYVSVVSVKCTYGIDRQNTAKP